MAGQGQPQCAVPLRIRTQIQALPRGTQIGAAPPDDSPDAAAAAAGAQAAFKTGDYLAAYDVAMSAKQAGASDPQLDFWAVSALARMGDTHMAQEQYEQSGLGSTENTDWLSLGARLKKDLAEKASASQRAACFAEASAAYREVYERDHAYFPGINAATTAFLAGETDVATALATEVLADPEVADPKDYYAAATAGEANLLLGRGEEALRWMRRAIELPYADVGSKASTFRQMALLAAFAPDRAAMIVPLKDVLRPLPILFYTGHMFVENARQEAAVGDKIDAALDELDPGAAYGALACGADILVAEAILDRGIELHLVFPFVIEDFIDQSVRPGGDGWIGRFERCLGRATQVSFATDMNYIGDPNLFNYGSSVAMGLAHMRARHLRTEAVQLALLETGDGGSPAGTAVDVATWRELGHRALVVDPRPIDRKLDRPPPIAMPEGVERVAHSMIFADFAGFSKLDESALPVFVSDVLGRIGAALDEFGDKVLYRNSWGDALYAVIATATDAAEIVLRLQQRLRDMPQALLDCAGHCGMRMGVHHGPIYRAHDAVMKRPSFFGTEVTRTARIEPVTPTGEVYATEAFAAMLALESERRFGTHYVGRVQLAKGYGELAMYKLSRLGEEAEG